MIAVVQTLYRWKLFLIFKACCLLLYFFRPNCFQIVVQHFSEEQYIFYFAGEATEQAQVNGESALYCHRKWSNKAETHTHSYKCFYTHTFIFLRAEGCFSKRTRISTSLSTFVELNRLVFFPFVFCQIRVQIYSIIYFIFHVSLSKVEVRMLGREKQEGRKELTYILHHLSNPLNQR